MMTVLDPDINENLLETYHNLEKKGKLIPQTKLPDYYQTFRDRFGPDVLEQLDGETLLLRIHAHGSHDSLVYWLEFKDDEELPAKFGSIAGGSALKFGIYRRKETGEWMTGTPTSQKKLSLQEAIDIARKHRDQLINGCKLLDSLPEKGTDEDYLKIQKGMNELAPDVSNLAWKNRRVRSTHFANIFYLIAG